jgi:hypothetical protein
MADGYTVGLRFSRDSQTWTTATAVAPEARLLRSTTLGDSDQEMVCDIPSGFAKVFWQSAVS